MLEHLVHFSPEPSPPGALLAIASARADQLLAAQVATTAWLDEIGAPPDDAVELDVEKSTARQAFGALTATTDTLDQKAALVRLKTPEAVRHLTGMLTAYDWEFVEYAKNLRGYTVAKLVEETTNNNANIRLKALALLGKVTEVGLFTDKVEIKQAPASDDELDARIKEKLDRFMGVVDALDVAKNQEILEATAKEAGDPPPEGPL